MLNRSISIVLFFTFLTPAFSQTNSKSGFVNLSYTYGASSKLWPRSTYYGNQSGSVSTVEISNVPDERVGYFVDFITSSYDLSPGYIEASHKEATRNYGIAGGARVFTDNKKVFFDVGAGCYKIDMIKVNNFGFDWSGYSANKDKLSFGVTAGVGTRLSLGNACSLVLKGRVSNVFINESSDGFFQEASLNAGIEVDNVKQNFSAASNQGNITSGIILGNTGSFRNKFSGAYGAELTLGVSDNFSLVANYLHKKSEQDYQTYSNATSETWENNYSGGVRNYFGESYLKPFLECLASLNISKENVHQYSDDILIKNSIGVGFGTGAEFALSSNVTGIIKGNYTFFDNADNAAGMYGGLKFQF